MFRTVARDVHVHLWPTGSEEERRHVLLRDWLRQSETNRELYARAKRELAMRPWRDVNYYAEAKSTVIATILQRVAKSAANAEERDSV